MLVKSAWGVAGVLFRIDAVRANGPGRQFRNRTGNFLDACGLRDFRELAQYARIGSQHSRIHQHVWLAGFSCRGQRFRVTLSMASPLFLSYLRYAERVRGLRNFPLQGVEAIHRRVFSCGLRDTCARYACAPVAAPRAARLRTAAWRVVFGYDPGRPGCGGEPRSTAGRAGAWLEQPARKEYLVIWCPASFAHGRDVYGERSIP